MWKMKKEDVIVVIRALGTVASRFEKLMEKLVLDLSVEILQKPRSFGTARILQRVLNIKRGTKAITLKITGCDLL